VTGRWAGHLWLILAPTSEEKVHRDLSLTENYEWASSPAIRAFLCVGQPPFCFCISGVALAKAIFTWPWLIAHMNDWIASLGVANPTLAQVSLAL
jgi:hypothetical protein